MDNQAGWEQQNWLLDMQREQIDMIALLEQQREAWLEQQAQILINRDLEDVSHGQQC